ncbi:unnamed protein product [Schistosoma curassoni]|nr:unnamed protein product [Schistosoma curassoni]
MRQVNNWHSIPVDPQDFNLFSTLNSGQAFRWIFNSTLNEWHGVINGHLWRLRQMEDSNPVEYYFEKNLGIKLNDVPFDLRDYFRLDMNLSDLVKEWSLKDEWFENRFSKNCQTDTARGLRLLRQDPEETLFSFITSANNNLTRITKLLCKLCSEYGNPLYLGNGDLRHWTFPSLEILAQPGMQDNLKKIGFGYRSKFITLAANWLLKNGGRSRLLELRSMSHFEAQAFLIQIPGIGKKVADCICLMSLDKLNVVPIDVHMHRVAREKGIPEASCENMTTKSYDIISKSLSDFWGNYSGWAQTILFYTRMMESKPNNAIVWLGSGIKKQNYSPLLILIFFVQETIFMYYINMDYAQYNIQHVLL